MDPRTFLRIEGGAVLAAALGTYVWLDGPIWLLAVLALAPDLSMVGYLAGSRIGSRSYNLAHTYATPLALAAVSLASGSPLGLLVATVWMGHIGADRLVGYGLKFESAFTDTHLSPEPIAEPRNARGLNRSGPGSTARIGAATPTRRSPGRSRRRPRRRP